MVLNPCVPKKEWLRESCSRINSSGIGLFFAARDCARLARTVDSASVIGLDAYWCSGSLGTVVEIAVPEVGERAYGGGLEVVELKADEGAVEWARKWDSLAGRRGVSICLSVCD